MEGRVSACRLIDERERGTLPVSVSDKSKKAARGDRPDYSKREDCEKSNEQIQLSGISSQGQGSVTCYETTHDIDSSEDSLFLQMLVHQC